MAHLEIRFVVYKILMPERKAKGWREITRNVAQETDLQKACKLSQELNQQMLRANPHVSSCKPQERAS